jgi:penicillin-binding protein 1A
VRASGGRDRPAPGRDETVRHLTRTRFAAEDRAVKHFIIALLLVPLLLAAGLYALVLVFGHGLPSPESPREMESSLSTRIIDCHGRAVDELYVEDRVPLQLAQVPPAFLQAILATEDRQFYKHWGINSLSLVRAIFTNVRHGRVKQGASTITQQLAWNLFLDHRRTLTRKIREAILALRIERSFSKDEILEMYVNQIYFGEGAYGLEAASRRFFGVPTAELTLEQCALLAGMPGNPAAFSPRRHPEAAQRRRDTVLHAMLETGAIDDATFQRAVATPLGVRERAGRNRAAAYFTEAVRRELADRYGTDRIYHDGLAVETTLDLDFQLVAEQALETQMRKLEGLNLYPYLFGRAEAMLAANHLPPQAQLQSPLRLQGAVIVIDMETGAVRAMVGGRDFAESPFNRATQAPRQSASTFKPFIYTEAIRQGYRTTDILLDAPVSFPLHDGRGGVYTIHDFDDEFFGPVTLRFALMKSVNCPTARLLDAVGIRRVVDLVHQMGVRTRIPPVISLAAGAAEMTLIEITSAFSAFGNHGIRVEPYLIDNVHDRYGHALEQHTPQSAQVIDERTAAIMTSMLQTVIDHGTAYKARGELGLVGAAAGKTGTMDECTDAWFVGFTPEVAIGVWVGFDWKIPIGTNATATGSAAALPIWVPVANAAQAKATRTGFEIPLGLVQVRTCLQSGLLAKSSCPTPIDDLFLPGTQPREYCTRH